jgi:hypothetical protein
VPSIYFKENEMAQAIKMRLRNDRSSSQEIRLEPWGEIYEFPGGDTIEVEASGPDTEMLEIEVGESSVTVHGWVGSAVRLLRNGRELAR